MKGLHQRVLDKFGRTDVLVDAGIHSTLPVGFKKMTHKNWSRGMALNLDAHSNLIHQFLPTFTAQHTGNIIHFTSISSTVGLGLGNKRHAYAAGKSAAATLTKRTGIDYAKQGVRGNVIAIGYVIGPNRAVETASTDIDCVTAIRDSYVPRGYQGTPGEIASVAAFLASDDSSYINGNEIFVDGGSAGCCRHAS